MREWLLILALAVSLILAVGLTALGCSGGAMRWPERAMGGRPKMGWPRVLNPSSGGTSGTRRSSPRRGL